MSDDGIVGEETAITRLLLRGFVAFLVVLCLAFFVCSKFITRLKTFTLNAQTEELRIDIQDPRGASVWLPGVQVGGAEAHAPSSSGSVRLDLENGVRIAMARVREGDVQIQLDWPASSGGARLSNGTPLQSGTVIHIPLIGTNDASNGGSKSLLLSFRGVLRVGNDVGPQVQRTLLGGNVTIIEKALLGDERYVVDSDALEPGDLVSWEHKKSAKPQDPLAVTGFVHVGSAEALTVVAHADADHIHVIRYGAESYDIAPSWISSVSHDPRLAAIAGGIAVAAALFSLVLPMKDILELFQKRRHDKERKDQRPRRTVRAHGFLAAGAMSVLAGLGAGRPVHAQEVGYLNSQPTPSAHLASAQGNAWLFNRGGQCYAVTPRHVLVDDNTHRDDHYARIVVARVGQQPVEGAGDRCAIFRKYDLAVLRVSGVAQLADCGRILSGIADESGILARSQDAALVTAESSGRFERATLSVRGVTKDPDYFWVAASSDQDRLAQGMSGGLVTVQDQLVGFLVSVGSDQEIEGLGRVLRADRAAVLLTRLLDGTSSPGEADGSCAVAPANSFSRLAPSLNLTDARCGAAVTQWSVPPLSASSRPEELLTSGADSTFWRVTDADEVKLEIRLCGVAPSKLTTVSLDTTGCPASDNHDLDVEILSRVAAEESYQSLGFGTLPAAGALTINSGSPRASRQLLLRFVIRGGAARPVCVHSVAVH